jgi:hypothetical protein
MGALGRLTRYGHTAFAAPRLPALDFWVASVGGAPQPHRALLQPGASLAAHLRGLGVAGREDVVGLEYAPAQAPPTQGPETEVPDWVGAAAGSETCVAVAVAVAWPWREWAYDVRAGTLLRGCMTAPLSSCQQPPCELVPRLQKVRRFVHLVLPNSGSISCDCRPAGAGDHGGARGPRDGHLAAGPRSRGG